MTRRFREVVEQRAQSRCEYCLALAKITPQTFHIEHIIPLSKGGTDEPDNLCLACSACNFAKREHTTGIDDWSGQEAALFNPRIDKWADHFVWNESGLELEGKTSVGRATINRLRLNRDKHVDARAFWIEWGIHPPNE